MGNKITVRCPYCGDSQRHLDKGHLTVYIDTLSFYCFRCGTHGELSIKDAMALLSLVPSAGAGPFGGITLPLTRAQGAYRGAESHSADITTPPATWDSTISDDARFSEVRKRWQSGGFDIFEMRTKAGSRTGFHLRKLEEKRSYTIGKVGLGYFDDKLSPRKVWKVVEGPYDVLDKDFVCTFGVPTESMVRELGIYDLILVPDGDVWQKPELYIRWFRPFINLKVSFKEVWKIPGGKDIDEAEEIIRVESGTIRAGYFRLLKANQGGHAAIRPRSGSITFHLSAG